MSAAHGLSASVGMMILAAAALADPSAAGDAAAPPVPLPAAAEHLAADMESPEGEGSAGDAYGAPEVPAGTGTGAEGSDAPGSRLLRVLSEAAGRGVVPAEPGAEVSARPGTLPVFAAEGCPRALLRRLLAGAASEADALSALAIEREILVLCRERQEIVAGLFETEARLRALRAAGDEAAPERAPAAPVAAAPAVQAAPSPLRAALAAAAVPEEKTPPAARYGWFSIIGSAGALRAGVTDGIGVWFVREGDALPGGGRVAAVAGRPPGVRVIDPGGSGEETLLPYRARPGGAP